MVPCIYSGLSLVVSFRIPSICRLFSCVLIMLEHVSVAQSFDVLLAFTGQSEMLQQQLD